MLTIFSGTDIWTNWIIGIEGGTINLITTLDAIKRSQIGRGLAA